MVLEKVGVQYDAASTVMVLVSLYVVPFTVMEAVMVAVPADTPVTVAVVPLPLTVATLVLLEV